MRSLKFLSSSILLLALNSMALVDYSDSGNGANEKQGNSKNISQVLTKATSPSPAKSGGFNFSFGSNFESLTSNNQKIGVVNYNLNLQTPMDIYTDVSFWQAHSDQGTSSGNAKFLFGFNWFKIGSSYDEARVDLVGGMQLASNSKLASSRNDKIVGIETTKHFGRFGIGLGYEYTMAGTPSDQTEAAIGNIQRINASIGWMVSNDIQMELMAEDFSIRKSSLTSRAYYLNTDQHFSSLSPKLNLGLFPYVNLELGARFQLSKMSSRQNWSGIKLLDKHGSTSTSLFAGLGIQI